MRAIYPIAINQKVFCRNDLWQNREELKMSKEKFKLKKLPKVNARNHVVLHPLMHKGGVFNDEKVDVQRARERRQLRVSLRKTDWLSGKKEE